MYSYGIHKYTNVCTCTCTMCMYATWDCSLVISGHQESSLSKTGQAHSTCFRSPATNIVNGQGQSLHWELCILLYSVSEYICSMIIGLGMRIVVAGGFSYS